MHRKHFHENSNTLLQAINKKSTRDDERDGR